MPFDVITHVTDLPSAPSLADRYAANHAPSVKDLVHDPVVAHMGTDEGLRSAIVRPRSGPAVTAALGLVASIPPTISGHRTS